MNAKFQIKDNREWWGLGLSEDFMPHLEGKAFIQLQAMLPCLNESLCCQAFLFSFFFFQENLDV